ncbi:MAG: hypothetical protein WD295_01130, partial [Bacteroidota bacterium]
HTDSLRSFFKFAGNEAGEPFVYINGGVWPHTNAWYALALIAAGRGEEAYSFVRDIMTLAGIIDSPTGQPAFYEYRCADSLSSTYGKVDKPSFLWAAGMYLNVLYAMFGVRQEEWNLTFHGMLPGEPRSVTFTLLFGSAKRVSMTDNGKYLEMFSADGTPIPSLVVPLEAHASTSWELSFGQLGTPYLAGLNALLHSASYDRHSKSLKLAVSSFQNHRTRASIVGADGPRRILLNEVSLEASGTQQSDDGTVTSVIEFNGSADVQLLEVFF